MGFKHVDAAIKARLPHQIGIDMGTLKLVLIAICQHADNETNTCFPSTRRLAKMTHLGKSTCGKAVGFLNGMGCFDVYSRGAGHGSSFYRIDLERLKEWEIDFSVRETDATDESDVHVVDSGMLEETPSVHPVDVASTTGTQCPRGSTQSPPAEPNLSFDRSVVPSRNSINSSLPLALRESENLEKPNQSKSKPDGSPVASQKQNRKACPDCGKPWHPFDECEDLLDAKAAVASSVDGLMKEL